MKYAAGDFLTIQQMLAILPVGKSMLYRLIEEGQLRHIRVRSVASKRGRILVHRSALGAYLQRQEAEAMPKASARVDVDELRDRITRTPCHTKPGIRSGRRRT